MENLLQLLSDNATETITMLTVDTKDQDKVKSLIEEYNEVNRDQRDTQIGSIQEDKLVGQGKDRKLVKAVKIPIPFQNKIVTTATAFEVGTNVTIVPSEQNKLYNEVDIAWKNNRIDSKLQRLKNLQKSELQCALLFCIKEIKPNSIINKLLGLNKKKEIKVRILENKNGIMSPYFDSFGDMKAFVWEFTTKEGGGKEIKYAWVYDDKNVYECSTSKGTMALDKVIDHGFGKIPIVYLEQEHTEWHIAEKMIDRLEVSLSKLGNSNDYTGHPILKIFGEVKGAPGKDESGKAFHIPMKKDGDGKWQHGDVDFLTYDQAPEAVKLEMDRLEKYIYSLTSTPDISFDNLKGLGNVSGVAIKLMFLDAMIKAKMNEGENRTIVERILNLFIAGNIETTNTSFKSLANSTTFSVQFNSIIPDDIKSAIDMYSTGIGSGIISQKTAIDSLSLTDDTDAELERIQNSQQSKDQQVENLIYNDSK